MDKMKMESVDMTANNIEKIGKMFPNCITETKNENGKLKPCLRTIINCYGKTLFRNEIEFDLEKILSCLVNTRVNIMHIKINQRKPALDGRESVLYAIKMSYLYRLVILEKLEINAILYEDNLIKRVGYIDGWNAIQEQLFNRLKQFL